MIRPPVPHVLALLPALVLQHALPALAAERTLASPDGRLVFTLEHNSPSGQLAWSLARDGRRIVSRGDLGLELAGFGVIGDEGEIAHTAARSVNASWTPPYGERAVIPDRFREETLTLSHASHGTLTLQLQVRAADEGLALRYRVGGGGTLTVTAEHTSFPLPPNTMVWVAPTAQGVISHVPITSMPDNVERPLTAEIEPNLFVACGEAALLNHARMKFSRRGASTLVPALDGPATYQGSFVTPWRYVRAADSPAALLEGNHFLLNLNEPSRRANPRWLRPGKLLREVTLTTAGGIACVDWAAAHGLDFVHIDAGWYGHEYDADSDATTVTVDPARSPGPLDLPAVIAHAARKNIGIVLYVNRRALETQLDTLLPLYRRWGVAGVKFGFVNVGSQRWTQWLHDAIARCADYELMVNVHDEYRMTGVERTFPNFMTAEGIRGDEESPGNEMVLRTIFTRGLAGAGDQTNCYFARRVRTMGSHASQLAKTICLYSPWQYLFWYDRPPDAPGAGGAGGSASVLQDVPELSFFERLPTVWDETRWLGGHPETHAIVARRKGDRWFLGALNGSAPRPFSIPLGFLPADQTYRLELFSDDPSVNTVTRVRLETMSVTPTHVLERSVAARNGLAAILTPVSQVAAPNAPPP